MCWSFVPSILKHVKWTYYQSHLFHKCTGFSVTKHFFLFRVKFPLLIIIPLLPACFFLFTAPGCSLCLSSSWSYYKHLSLDSCFANLNTQFKFSQSTTWVNVVVNLCSVSAQVLVSLFMKSVLSSQRVQDQVDIWNSLVTEGNKATVASCFTQVNSPKFQWGKQGHIGVQSPVLRNMQCIRLEVNSCFAVTLQAGLSRGPARRDRKYTYRTFYSWHWHWSFLFHHEPQRSLKQKVCWNFFVILK